MSAGERYGFIRFGSRVDVYLPPNYLPQVMIGDKVKAGIDVIARTPPSPAVRCEAVPSA